MAEDSKSAVPKDVLLGSKAVSDHLKDGGTVVGNTSVDSSGEVGLEDGKFTLDGETVKPGSSKEDVVAEILSDVVERVDKK